MGVFYLKGVLKYMDEFIVQLITRLDTSNAITDLNKLKGQLESKNINLKTVLDKIGRAHV